MSHKHNVYDTDTHFSINPITRTIKNESSSKTSLMQYDHNSERFTFEMPRYVEEHDMSLCNLAQVHFLNIDAKTKETNADVYDVEDLQISPDGDDVVICSWIISRNATLYAGSLHFVLRFACVDDEGNLSYIWNTAVYTGISVSDGINNGDIIEEEYSDILAAWEARFLYLEENMTGASPEVVENAVNKYFDKHPVASNPNLIDNWYLAKPVNQRGQTEYYSAQKAGVYTIDRWYFDAWYRYVGLTDKGLYLATKNSSDGEVEDAVYGTNMYQLIDNIEAHEGRTVTVSAIINGTLRSATGTLGKKNIEIQGTGSQGTVTLNWSETKQMYVLSLFATKKDVIFQAVKLELGARQTLAHQDADGNWVLNDIPDYGAELAKCQRYQLPLFGSMGTYATLGFARVSGVSVKTAEMIVPIPVTMRANPTLVKGNAAFQLYSSETEYAAVTSIAFSAIAPGFVRLYIVVDKELTGGNMYVLRKTTDDLVMLDANL